MNSSPGVDDPAMGWCGEDGVAVEEEEEEDLLLSRVPCHNLNIETKSKLLQVIQNANYQQVLNLTTILKKTDRDGQDTSLRALEEEERDLLEAAQEDEEGRLVLRTPQTPNPTEEMEIEDIARPEGSVERRNPRPDPDLLCKIMIMRQRKVIPCGERFASYEILLDHMEMIHHIKKSLLCQPCKIRFTTLKEITHHSLHCPHNEECPFCNLRYVTLKALRVHMSAQHGGDMGRLSNVQHRTINMDRICPQCHKMMTKPSVLKKHMERGKCIPVTTSEERPPAVAPLESAQNMVETPLRSLRQTREHHQTLSQIGLPPKPGQSSLPPPPKDHRGNTLQLPQNPLGPDTFDIVYPHAQTKNQVKVAGTNGKICVSIPLTHLTDKEMQEGAFCLAYRCALCHLIVVSDLGALIYHQLKCKRIDLRSIKTEEYMKLNRCFLCGKTLPSFSQFMSHHNKCRNESYDAQTFHWHGPPPP